MRWSLALPACLALAACGDEPAAAPETSDTAAPEVADTADLDTADAADTDTPTPTLTWDGAGLVLSRGDEPLLTLPVAGVEVATFDGDLDAWTWDPWWLDQTGPVVELATFPEITWHRATSARLVDGALVVSAGERELGTLSFDQADLHRVELRLAPALGRAVYVRVRLTPTGPDLLYGGGNQHDTPALNGKRVALQLEPDTSLETLYNERHVTVPLLVGSRGWAALVDSERAQDWDLGARSGDLTLTVGGPLDRLTLRLWTADHPLDLYRGYYTLTGLPRLPPDWGYGPWVWRDETPGQGTLSSAPDGDNPGVEHDLATIRALDLPTSAYWIDRPYATALNTFDFAATYPDPAAMIARAHAHGFRMALWHVPYALPASGEVYETIVREGYLPPTSGLLLNTFGGTPLDLTNPEAVTFWQGELARYLDLGVEGFKLDFAEDVVHGLPGVRSNAWAFHDGSDERVMHTRYAGLYHRTYRAAMAAHGPGQTSGGFIFARAGRAGGQAHVDALWPGDLDADLAPFGQAEEGERGRVGGVPAALAYALSTSASGYPFFAADTGGYRNGPPSNEAYRRWFELTSVMPVMQVGGDDNQVPWEAGVFGWDATLLDDYREHARLHVRLFPYVKALATALHAADGGRPLVRPFGLEHPECGEEPGDVYFLGDALLVAPVVVEGQREREVLFPAGRWIDWWTGAERVVTGAPGTCRREQVAAPLGRVPLFVRAGAIVPLLRPTVDTLAPATAEGVDSAADLPGTLWVRVVPGASGAFALHDGTTLTLADGALDATPGARWDGPPIWELHLGDAPTPAVTAPDGTPYPEVADLEALAATTPAVLRLGPWLYVHAEDVRLTP